MLNKYVRVKLLFLFLILILSLGIVIVLYMFSDQPNRKPNHFSRNFHDSILLDSVHFDHLPFSYALSGIFDGKIYLSNRTGPAKVIVIEPFKRIVNEYPFLLSTQDNNQFALSELYIDSISFNLIDLSSHTVYSGSINNWESKGFSRDNTTYESARPFNKRNGSIYRMHERQNGFYLAKKCSPTDSLMKNTSLLTKQIDGTFCKDGKLLFNKQSEKIVYVYYYRNEFVVADTGLNLLYRGKTIDTVSKAKIKLGIRNKNGELKMAAPPVVVNKNCTIGNKNIFIYSVLKADNEPRSIFSKSAVIDVYKLENGKYDFSFHIPKNEDQKLLDLGVDNDMLAVLFNTGLVIYRISNSSYSKQDM